MKLFARPNSFYEAMTLVIFSNYVLGLRVFEYPRGYPRSVLSLIYILTIFVTFITIGFNMDNYLNNIKLLKLDYILYIVTGYIFIVSLILKMFMGWWHSKKIAVCYKKIFEIDKTLRQLGLTVKYDEIYFITIGFIISWFILLIFLGVTSFFFFKLHIDDIFQLIYMTYASLISSSIDYVNAFEFYAFSRLLHTKFKLINHLLRETIRNLSMQKEKLDTFKLKDYTKLLDFEQQRNIPSIKILSQWQQRIYSASNFILSKRSSVTSEIETHIPFYLNKELQCKFQNRFYRNIFTPKYKNHKHLLQITKQMHLELCKVSKLICSAFEIQISWEVGVVIIYIVQTIYNCYNQFIGKILRAGLDDVFIQIILCCISVLRISLLSSACRNAANEGNKTVELIHVTYGCNTDIDTQEEMQQFGIQILQSPVIFYLFGMAMDNHILSMILKNITTYMVIMVQVSSSLESNSDIKDMHF